MRTTDLVVLVLGWTAGWILLWRPPRLPVGRPETPPTVSLVVPARDEADRLPLLLASVAAQGLRPDEVVVVDDGSRDATSEVARAAGATVVPAPERPEGWTGKTWACHVGVGATRGEVVVLADADVVLGPEALASTVALVEAHGGLVSVQPHHRPVRAVEALSLVPNVVAVMGLGIATPGQRGAGWGAAGPLMAATRADLDAAGGYGAVRSSVAEDLALGRRFGEAGLPVTCVLGGGQVSFRMYRSLSGLWEGWTKNMATGATSAPLGLTLGVAAWVTAALVAVILTARVAVDPPLTVALGAGAYAAMAVQVHVLGRRVGSFGAAALVWPLLVATFVAIVSRSLVATYLVRRVRWSGRSIAVGRSQP